MVTKKSFSFWIRESGMRGFYGKLAKKLKSLQSKKAWIYFRLFIRSQNIPYSENEEKMYNFNKKTKEMSFTV